ncbi:hypothetical protein BV22DRAFT_1117026 [Leucogyrophana mollusca]|uniref:Uncharacterized protein n=1 Tax=Leucogyrophana mollusca TaxID=85980 RepID=A0ACB8BUL9_9AGAM|nr:hypothetical protein BV22DRAFT_1117026 [Leucogyrophana mollusca]
MQPMKPFKEQAQVCMKRSSTATLSSSKLIGPRERAWLKLGTAGGVSAATELQRTMYGCRGRRDSFGPASDPALCNHLDFFDLPISMHWRQQGVGWRERLKRKQIAISCMIPKSLSTKYFKLSGYCRSFHSPAHTKNGDSCGNYGLFLWRELSCFPEEDISHQIAQIIFATHRHRSEVGAVFVPSDPIRWHWSATWCSEERGTASSIRAEPGAQLAIF